MQSMINLCASYGVPLCLSGISHRLPLSQEMADHDIRREAMKKQMSRARSGLHANQEMDNGQRNFERVLGEIVFEEDLSDMHDDLSRRASTAKAA